VMIPVATLGTLHLDGVILTRHVWMAPG